MDCRIIGERSDAVLQTAMSGNDERKKARKRTGKRNADRRVSNRPHLTDAAACSSEHARLSAFHRGFSWRCRNISVQLQARLPGTRPLAHDPEKWTPVFRSDHAPLKSGFARWALPTPACPSPVAPTAGHSAGGMIPKAARVRFARPPAGTALAPYVG